MVTTKNCFDEFGISFLWKQFIRCPFQDQKLTFICKRVLHKCTEETNCIFIWLFFAHSFICSFFCLFMCLFVSLLIFSFVHLFICSFVHLFICPFVQLFICSFVHLLICFCSLQNYKLENSHAVMKTFSLVQNQLKMFLKVNCKIFMSWFSLI
jgi:hypothetical protein